MRLLGLFGQVLVPIVSAGTLGWWIATLVMRLLVRRYERTPPLAAGPPTACCALLTGFAVAASLSSAAVAMLLFWALARAPGLVSLPDGQPVAMIWRILVWAGAGVAAAAAVAAAVTRAAAAMSAARRRWELLDLSRTQLAEPAEPPPLGAANTGWVGRRIVILCDGTSNRPDEQEDGQAAATNVWKLSQALASDEVQTVWYQAGVGSDTSSTAKEARRTQAALAFFGANAASQVSANGSRLLKVIEAAFGTGISETIIKGYTEVVRQYRPGDKIYLVGFSRGAYAARCIAGVISRCGLLRAENIRYAAEMVQIYRTRPDQAADAKVRPDLLHRDRDIEFVGVFDTVASLGVPLWGWWFRASPIWVNKALATDPVSACHHVYHALAMDERRSQFIPTLYTRPTKTRLNDKLETLEQVWFRGAHADIGGGYARCDLSNITLGWMMEAMARHGLRFREDARAKLRPDALGRTHDELEREPDWILFGSWPRWHPVPDAGPDVTGTKLHQSVLERAAAVQARAGRPDLLRLPSPGDVVTLMAEAQRVWDRTGVVIDAGGYYRITYLGSAWRDADADRCGPFGQEASSFFDLRRWWATSRRLRHQPWMRLVATVAHPRHWELKEKSLAELVRLLFHNDPPELTRQLAAIGADLAVPGDAIVLHNLAPAGLLHLFANDWWQAAGNNSGGVQLRIERLREADPWLRLWTLGCCGTWRRTCPAVVGTTM